MRFTKTTYIERIGFDFYCDIAKNIVKLRQAKNLTQAELAEKTKIKTTRLSNIENVKTRVKLDELKQIAHVLETAVDYLIDAEIDSQIGKCRYLIWIEDASEFRLYFDSTSKRLAYLEFEEMMNEKGYSLTSFINPRVRAYVKLVGVPVSDKELNKRFAKFDKEKEEVPEK